MAKVDPNTLRNWNDGEIIHAGEYKQERTILVTAINETTDKLASSYYTKDYLDSQIALIQNGKVYSIRSGDTFPLTPTESDVFFLNVNQTISSVTYPGDHFYIHINGSWRMIPTDMNVAENAAAGTLVKRDSQGHVKTTAPTSPEDAARKADIDVIRADTTKEFAVEVRTDAPSAPKVGRMWFLNT